MIQLIFQQQYMAFVLISFALIFSLTFHEYGHGKVASMIGDDTARNAGRLTLNPIPHIDPLGLLLVLLVGFGYAKPVPTDPRNFNTRWGVLLVAAAGPAMNLLLAVVAINLYQLGLNSGLSLFQGTGAYYFFTFFCLINLLPIGPLDGHYILPYFLPRSMALNYMRINQRFGTYALLLLIGLNFAGLPIVESIMKVGNSMLGFVTFL